MASDKSLWEHVSLLAGPLPRNALRIKTPVSIGNAKWLEKVYILILKLDSKVGHVSAMRAWNWGRIMIWYSN